jgi:hypothetical protein
MRIHTDPDAKHWVKAQSYCVSRYQKELPKKIKERGKDAFLTHDEIVQCIKWKLAVSSPLTFLALAFPTQGVLKGTVSPDDTK